MANDRAGKLEASLARASQWNVIFYFSVLTVGWATGRASGLEKDVVLLAVTIWLELCRTADPPTNWVQSCSACLRLCPRYGTCPSYFCGICTPLTEVGRRVRLRSAHRGDLCVPSTRTEFGKFSFRVAAARTWNSTATSPFANHQQTTVPVWAQNSSLQMHLHMTFTSENYWGVNLFTGTYLIFNKSDVNKLNK